MKRTSKRGIALVTVAIVAGLVAIAAWPREKTEFVLAASAIRVPELKAVVNGSGEIRTHDSVDIQAEIAGVIIELSVREGDRVLKDQLLLRIDPFQTESDVLSARAALSSLEVEAAGQAFQVASAEATAAGSEFLKKASEVELRQAELNVARAVESFDRETKLLEANLTSPDTFEIAQTQLKLRQSEVEAAKARVDQVQAQLRAAQAGIEFARSSRGAILERVAGARASLARAEDLLRRTTIRSPLDGVVVKLNVEAGERAVPGILSNPQATLMTIADLAQIEAELQVDETDIVNVTMDDPARVLVDALPDAPLVGHVVEIGNSPILSATGSQEGKDFKVVLRIDSPPEALRPGMSCEADITTEVRMDVLVVPIQALTMREILLDPEGRYVPDTKEGDRPSGVAAAEPPAGDRKEVQGVFLVDDRRARFQPVKTGILGEIDAEVLDGLQAGKEVVVGPLKALRQLEEGAAIEVDRTRPFRRTLRARGIEDQEAEE